MKFGLFIHGGKMEFSTERGPTGHERHDFIPMQYDVDLHTTNRMVGIHNDGNGVYLVRIHVGGRPAVYERSAGLDKLAEWLGWLLEDNAPPQ